MRSCYLRQREYPQPPPPNNNKTTTTIKRMFIWVLLEIRGRLVASPEEESFLPTRHVMRAEKETLFKLGHRNYFCQPFTTAPTLSSECDRSTRPHIDVAGRLKRSIHIRHEDCVDGSRVPASRGRPRRCASFRDLGGRCWGRGFPWRRCVDSADWAFQVQEPLVRCKPLQQAKIEKPPVSMRFTRMFKKRKHDASNPG